MLIHSQRSRYGGRARVLLACLRRRSKNIKTGDQIQAFILASGLHPARASELGRDRTVCADCGLRRVLAAAGAVVCYLGVTGGMRSVGAAWKAHRGARVEWPKSDALAGRSLRLGAYGDPGVVASRVWRRLVAMARNWTGFTHLWRTRPDLKDLCMASTTSPAEYHEAVAAGWRSYRVRQHGEPLMPNEIACPYPRTQCARCHLCNGSTGPTDRRKNIATYAKG